VVLAVADASVHKRTNLADEPRDDLQFDSTPALAAPASSREAQRPLDYAALARSAQIAGALQSALERSIGYALERKQFGRAIGQFQAVQQQLALFGAETAAATCASRSAAIAASAGDASFEIAAAKLRANQAIGVATATAHQVHGAIGFTREYALRQATQRLWSWRSEYGNDRYWSERLGRLVVDRGADTFWSNLTELSG
jgi:acyl-CoA dehydrogenase